MSELQRKEVGLSVTCVITYKQINPGRMDTVQHHRLWEGNGDRKCVLRIFFALKVFALEKS